MPSSSLEIYQTADGLSKISVHLQDETVWLTLDQLATLFDRDKSTVSRHIKNIFEERELIQDSVVANFATTATDGKTYQVDHYNLDVAISIGYRVKSQRGVQFRQWATKLINEYIRKGFTMDDDRLKNGGGRYFKELLQRIRDIRSSERNFYQQVTDIYATAIDYDPKAPTTREFFATVQNKMHYAAHQHTAAELIHARVDSDKDNVGMSNFKGDYVVKSDVRVAKNYLDEKELAVLNLLVSGFLDFAELQALEERSMTMADWVVELDHHLSANRRQLLMGKGTVSSKDAIAKAERELELYRAKEMSKLESDFDRAVKQLTKKN